VKHWGSRWLTAVLLGAVLLVLGILLVIGAPHVGAGADATGAIQLDFTATLTTSDNVPISQEYQRVLLNMLAVRLNPSNDLTISDADPSWVAIPAPAKVGLSNPTEFISSSLNFGGNVGSVELTAAQSVAQLDLITLQNIPFFLNGERIPAQTYNQVELVLNTTPGYVVPLCPQTAPAGEGCIPYTMALTSSTAAVPTQLRVNIRKFDVGANTSQPLVINLNAIVGPAPTGSPASHSVTTAVQVVPQGNTLLNGTPYNPAVGRVDGTVKNFTSATRVTAELSGTDNLIDRSNVQKKGTFVLNPPAVATPNSTLYDFYVSGNGTFVVRSGIPVSSQGGAPSAPISNLGTLTVTNSMFGTISGEIYDACKGAGVPIQAATLQLLAPDTTVPGTTNTNCDLDTSVTPPAIPSNCVVVASGATDDQGHYPLNGTAFTDVPLTLPEDVDHYDLEISAPGFNTMVQEVRSSESALSCPASTGPGCTFGLEHGYLSGSTALSHPNNSGTSQDLLVMAEQSGTDNVQNLALSVIGAGNTTGFFEMPVPAFGPTSNGSIPVTDYDVFASVQALFGDNPVDNTGQLFETKAGIGAPGACRTVNIGQLPPTRCAGLGSVTGTVNNANPSTTSVRMSKDGVQIMETAPNSIGVPARSLNNYSLCAPSDSYELSHYENGTEIDSVNVTLATPSSVPTPCQSICGNSTTSCLQCRPQIAPTL
jgi:hypothetical protein